MKRHYRQIRQLRTVAHYATGSDRYHQRSKFAELPGAERLKDASRKRAKKILSGNKLDAKI